MGRLAACVACLLLFAGTAVAGADGGGPWLGASLQPVDETLATALGRQAGGELVVGVVADSPALRAGLKPGDLITAVDGQPVIKDHSTADYVHDALAGVPVSLSLVREGQSVSLRVTLGARPSQAPVLDNSYFETATGVPGGDMGRHIMAGATLISLTPAIAEPLGLSKLTSGAVILAVEPGSSADEVGLLKGDVIFGVGGRRTESALAVTEAFVSEQSKGERPTLLFLGRGETRAFLTLPPKPLGLRQKWGPYWNLAGLRLAHADGQWVDWYSWIDRGKVLNDFIHHPGEGNGYNVILTLQEDGKIAKKQGDKVVGVRTIISDTEMDAVDDGKPLRWVYDLAADSVTISRFQLRRDGSRKPVDSTQFRRIDETEEGRLASAYQRQQVLLAQQQQAAQQAKQSGGGGGGLFGALGGAMLGAMAGGNPSQVVGAAMKGAAIVDPNAAALGSVGDSLITGNTASVGGVGGLAQNSGGGSYPTRPNLLDGSPACSMMNQSNYRQVGVSGGNDVQLKTMCAQAHEYYHMYLNAIAQGYSEADANRTYAAHQGAAQNAISFYENNR
jgi:membrane-associated protease RseP (regulator of RpoE activity)